MTKYFLKGTEEELHLGDALQLVLTKESENGSVKQCHLECEFTSDLIPLLMEFGVIYMKNIEENKVLDFEDSNIIQRVDTIEKELLEVKKLLVSITETIAYRKPKRAFNKHANK